MVLTTGSPCPQCGRKLAREAIGLWGFSVRAWLVLCGGIVATALLAWALVLLGVRPRGAGHRGTALFAMGPLVLAGGMMSRLAQVRTVRCACGFTTKERSR